ncbi:VanW family protein [Nocardioides sp. ChNu-99]|uniref:VanW family protein n=1 Tax=Nocardioides sp. ChNu-99 TaxID=2839897 RepID=UPI0024050C34|nr:VanW family protein [Nocardioides sp. ChNu-99]MDF9716418.1 VanW family protein [Nocardioides sp. ChNu-99]
MSSADESAPGGAAGPRTGRDAATRPDPKRERADTAERPFVPGFPDTHDEADDTGHDTGHTGPLPPRRRRGRRVAAYSLLGLLLVLGGLYVAAYVVAGDKVARGTTVAGVDIGGQPQDEAAATLEAGLADRVAQPLDVSVAGTDVTRQLDPAALGLAVDHEASVADAGGRRSWSPERLWTYFTGGEDLPAVVDSDPAAVEQALSELEQAAGQPAVEGAVGFEDGAVVVTEPTPGRGFDREAAAQRIEDAFVAEGGATELELADISPTVDAADVEAARAAFADPAVSAPVTLTFGDTPVELDPAEFSPALRMEARDGGLVGVVDGAVLKDAVDDRVGDPGRPVDASIVLQDGRPTVVPAQPGVDYLPETLASVFQGLVTAPEGSREGVVEATAAEPELTTEEAEALGVTELVSEFTTSYPHASYRNTNIGRAAELIDGTLLLPGETFSMNDTVGERTRENGFTEGYVISDGILRQDLGGGVSQMATTLFNAMFFAGLEDVEHKPHSFYIDRYPVGREATVVWGALDLRFKNDTEHGVLIDTQLDASSPGSPGSITVRMYSTKVWDIEETTSERHNFTQPSTRTLTTPDCEPHTGYRGFDVDVTRIFKRPGSGEVVREEVFSTTYTPSDTVVCRAPQPDPAPAPTPPAAPEETIADPAAPTG